MKIVIKRSIMSQFVCLLGCTIQIYMLTSEYLSYKVRSDATFEYPKTTELPAIDIRIPLESAINRTQLCINHKHDIFSSLFDSYKDENATIDNICDLASYDDKTWDFLTVKDVEQSLDHLGEKFKSDLFIKHSDYKNIPCENKYYFSFDSVIWRISCVNGTQIVAKPQNDFITYDNIFISIQLDFDISIRFSSHDKYPIVSKFSYIDTNLDFTCTKYVKTIVQSLESPYETNCLRYDKNKALQECITKNTTNSNPPYLNSLVQNEWNRLPGHYGFAHSHSDEYISRVVNDCYSAITAPECVSVSYQPVKLYEFNTNDENYPKTIEIAPAIDPILNITAYPAFRLDEYVIYIGSVLGLWFGFSISDRLQKGTQFDVLKFIRNETNLSKTKVNSQLRRKNMRTKIFTTNPYLQRMDINKNQFNPSTSINSINRFGNSI